MSAIDGLTFVKKAPSAPKASGKSALDKAREKFSADIDAQIKLARDPNFEIISQRKVRSTGEIVSTRRKPRSWVSIVGDDAFIVARFSNKPVPIGGKRGSVIKTTANDAPMVLEKVKQWAENGEADTLIDRLLNEAKRTKKKSEEK